MNVKILIALAAFLVSFTSWATTIRGTACYGMSNRVTPYVVTFEKRQTGTVVIAGHKHGRRFPIGSLSSARINNMNPDATATFFAGSVGARIIPIGRLLSVIRSGVEGMTTAIQNRTPRMERNEGPNGYQRTRWQICLRAINRGINRGQGVALSFDDEADLQWAGDQLSSIIWEN